MTYADARRAIYVDFECLKGHAQRPPRPALLGLLVGSDDEHFEQIIIDERLAPARVANPRIRVATPPVSVGDLLARAEAENRAIVGWSFFDRDRLIDARKDVEADINARYVNALHVARPWRKSMHPSSTIEREDQFAPKHTLDKYATLAGYSAVDAFRKAAPATWIRHALTQLHATGGRYRRTTAETRRDWHRLLEYNRHDCLALRHIVLRATREMECWHAYERTLFVVDEGPRQVRFKVKSMNRRLDALLRRHGATRWAFITAWNPASAISSRAENDARQRELVKQVESCGLSWLSGRGVGEDPAWMPEESLFVMGISPGKAIALGRAFGQLAVLVGRRGAPVRLVSCAAPAGARGPELTA